MQENYNIKRINCFVGCPELTSIDKRADALVDAFLIFNNLQ